MGQHLRRNVPGNLPDDGVIGLCFAELGDCVMPQVVEPQAVERGPYVANIGAALLIPASLSGLL